MNKNIREFFGQKENSEDTKKKILFQSRWWSRGRVQIRQTYFFHILQLLHE